jgi:CRISPR-associated protein (TIGR02584 family)
MPTSTTPPERYPRRILLAVTGLSPQILTETLFCLCRLRQPAYVPNEIHLITTREGGRHAELTLLHPHQGRFARFLDDFGLGGQIRFDADHIHVLAGADGQSLDDIRDDADNAAAADAITTLMREFTADPDSALHVSIAGGRKTMGFYLGYALTLFGRPQDRLSHVLVSPPFESNHQFYYPPPTPEVLFTRDNQPINTADAVVTLAEIPFVRLRHGLPDDFLHGVSGYTATVEAAGRSFLPPRLFIDPAQERIVCGDGELRLPPQLFAFYLWLARRRQRGGEYQGHARYSDDIAGEFLAEYHRLASADFNDCQATGRLMAEGMPREFFEEKKARINAALRRQLGLGAATYLIVASGKRPRQRFGLGLAAEVIEIIEDQLNQREVESP